MATRKTRAPAEVETPQPAIVPDPDRATHRATDRATDPAADGVAGLGYEEARDALTDIVRRLESGAASLEESLALWERGEALAAHCEQWLAGARARLEAAVAPRE